jgi:hypothetical protein
MARREIILRRKDMINKKVVMQSPFLVDFNYMP